MNVSLVVDLAPATVYSLRATPAGGQSGRTIALSEIADVHVVITEARDGGGIELSTQAAEEEGYLVADNETNGTVAVEIARNSRLIDATNIQSNGSLFYKPPPITSP
ncbi:MAG: hypothetical protein ACRDKH_09120 [Solirubrobacterales bacterium]